MTVIVLIPGAGGDSWYWHRVAPLLRNRGFTVVAPDLPAAEENATFSDYADAVVTALATTDESARAARHPEPDIVVVGQSLGGFTAVQVCERVPARMLVFLNAMIPLPGETAGAWWENTGQAAAQADYARSEGRDPDSAFDTEEIFFNDVPVDVVDEAFQRGETPQSDSVFATPWRASSFPDVDVRVIASRSDRLFPLAFMQRQSRDRLGIAPVIVDGGHLSALGHPEAVADAIGGFASE